MSGQYPVNATVTPIFPSAQPTPQTVKNIGLVTVYLGTSSSLSATSGYALGPGSALSWEAGKPLFAVTATGTSTLSILDNGGSLFDASAVAAQIQISGAPPTDPLSTIFTDAFTANANVGYNTAWINVSGWQSLTLRMAEDTGGTTYTAPLPRRVILYWSDSQGGHPFAEESLFISDTNASGTDAAFTSYQTAVKDAWLQVQWSATARAATLYTWLLGSYKTIARSSYTLLSAYQQLPAGWAGYGNGLDRLAAAYTSTAAFTNNTQYWYYPSVIAGAGYRSLVIAQTGTLPAGGSFDAFLYAMAESPIYLYGKRAYAGALPYEDDNPITVPFMPLGIMMRYNNSSPGAWTPAASLTLTYER